MKKNTALRFICLLTFALTVLFLSACEDENLNVTESAIGTNQAVVNTTNASVLSTGLQGFVYERLPDNSIGGTIASAKIIYTNTNDMSVTVVYSNSSGYHKADLPAGSYYVTVVHPSFKIYKTEPGVVVVTTGYSTFNIFLKRLTYGFTGICYERYWNGTIGGVLSSVKITFTKDDNLISKTFYSNAGGGYTVSLPAGKYFVTASKDGFYDYSSSPGYFVVTGTDGYETGNIFLKRKLIIVPLAGNQ